MLCQQTLPKRWFVNAKMTATLARYKQRIVMSLTQSGGDVQIDFFPSAENPRFITAASRNFARIK